MARKKRTACPSCGTEASDPYKTWSLAAPFPDKKMRITITTFGMFECTSCGKKFRAVTGKVKAGPKDVSIG